MIIAFSGPMGAGKSTAVEILKFMLRDADPTKKMKLIKFAQPLYDMQEMIYRRIESIYPRPEGALKDRKLLQYLGTDWGRSLSETIWVDLWHREAQAALEAGYVVVCDDCRFENEAEVIASCGGTVVKITADHGERRAASPNGTANHPSEAGISSKYVSCTIDNNATLDEYDYKIRQLFKQLLVPISAQKQGR